MVWVLTDLRYLPIHFFLSFHLNMVLIKRTRPIRPINSLTAGASRPSGLSGHGLLTENGQILVKSLSLRPKIGTDVVRQ